MANELIINGTVGIGMGSADYIRYALSGMDDNEPLNISIDSLGGNFVDAVSIYNRIKDYKGPTKAIYSGLCASAATIIGTACDDIEMTDGSAILIHKVSNHVDFFGYVNGDELERLIKDLKGQRKNLESLSELTALIYAKKTGKDSKEIMKLMSEDRWILPEEAVSLGLVDRIIESRSTVSIENKIKGFELVNNVKLPNIHKKENTAMFDSLKNFLVGKKVEATEADLAALSTAMQNEFEASLKKEFKNLIDGLNGRLSNIEGTITANLEEGIAQMVEAKVQNKVAEIHLSVTDKLKDAKAEPSPYATAEVESEDWRSQLVAQFGNKKA